MESSDMLRRLLECWCDIAVETAVEVADCIPHTGIRIKRQAANGNPGDKIASRGKNLFNQALIFSEEQNVAHQPAESFRRRQLINAVLRTFLQKKQRSHRGAAVLAGPRQFSGKGSAESRVSGGGGPQIRNFIREQSDAGWRQPGHGGLARARYARKQVSPPIANRAGSVQQQTAALGQNEAMHN